MGPWLGKDNPPARTPRTPGEAAGMPACVPRPARGGARLRDQRS